MSFDQKAYNQAYYIANREKLKAAAREYRARNPEASKERDRAKYRKDINKSRADRRAYAAAHKAEAAARLSRWEKANPHKLANYESKRRTGKQFPGLTKEEWLSIVELFGGRCAYCIRPVAEPEREHLLPLSRGGEDVADNVVPACKSCNSSKGKLTPVEYLMSGRKKF